MKKHSSAALRKRRHQLLRALPPIEQIVRGSLIETYKRCGRPSCHCVDGPGHGPKRYLSTIARTGERPRLGYVPNGAYPQVAEFLAFCRRLLDAHHANGQSELADGHAKGDRQNNASDFLICPDCGGGTMRRIATVPRSSTHQPFYCDTS